MKQEHRDEIIKQAELWLGTRWHHNACRLGAGVDCGRFLIAVYVAAGLIEEFDVGQYAPDFMMHRAEERFLGWVMKHTDEVDVPQRGDVAMWKFGKCFAHGAIVIEWPRVIHSYRHEGKVTRSDASKGRLAFNGAHPREVRFFSIDKRIP